MKSGDSEAIASHAHAIKGAGRNLGVKSLSGIAGQLEFAGRENDLETTTSTFDELKREFEKVMSFLPKAMAAISVANLLQQPSGCHGPEE